MQFVDLFTGDLSGEPPFLSYKWIVSINHISQCLTDNSRWGAVCIALFLCMYCVR
jgi:hypothetical protein